ncbi:MAG: hypothetical protein LBV51_02850 [Acholeplasmatales bacterium]|jgi:hypothetical protein|nr:hypothetical protein [Acholeplasmatales bacterium]
MYRLQTGQNITLDATSAINGPNGIILIIVVGVLGLFICTILLCCLITGKSLKDLLLGKKQKPDDGSNATDNPSESKNTDITNLQVQMSASSFNKLLNACNSVLDDKYDRKEDLKNRLNRVLITEQDECIKRVINTLSLEYSSALDDKKEQSNLDESTKVLDLYLQVDLNNILIQEFKLIRENDLEEYTMEDISDKVAAITDICVIQMKRKIRQYITTVNKEIFIKLFDNQIVALKENISKAIRKYVSSSKETKLQIDNMMETKTRDLEIQLRSFIEVV